MQTIRIELGEGVVRQLVKIVIVSLFSVIILVSPAFVSGVEKECNVTNRYSVVDENGRIFVASGEIEGFTDAQFRNFTDNAMAYYKTQCPNKTFTLKLGVRVEYVLSNDGRFKIKEIRNKKSFSIWYKKTP